MTIIMQYALIGIALFIVTGGSLFVLILSLWTLYCLFMADYRRDD